MKKVQSFKAPFLSITLIAAIEYFLVLATKDDTACFWHNSISGIFISWTLRLLLFAIFTILFTQLSTPAFKTLKERMIERDELEEKNKRQEQRKFAPGQYSYEG